MKIALTTAAIFVSLVAAACTPHVLLDYTPERIKELVQSGEANEHGAEFAASGRSLNSRTFFWKPSKNHHVFFFLRDGKSYGEYRDEVVSSGRFQHIRENYLVADQRTTPEIVPKTSPRYIRRDETLIWEAGEWVASDVQWTFIYARESGMILRSEGAANTRITLREMTVEVPPRLLDSATEYYIKAVRPQATDYEKAFGDYHVEGSRYYLAMSKVDGNRCTLRFKWPASRVLLLFELHKRKPMSPLDANPFIRRTTVVGSMTVWSDSLGGSTLEFSPE